MPSIDNIRISAQGTGALTFSDQASPQQTTTAVSSSAITVRAVGGSNLGTGQAIFTGANGATVVTLDFKTLVAGSGITLSSTANELTIGSTAENTATSLGSGQAVYAGSSGSTLQFKSLVGGSGITLTSDGNTVTVSSSAVAAGTNLGSGQAIFAGNNGSTLQFKSLVGSTGISLSSDSNTVTIGNGVSGSSLGSGQALYAGTTAATLDFKSLVGGAGIALTSDSNTVTVSNKNGLFVNVLDHGAVADGVTDNFAAIQAACIAAFQAGGGTVYFPPSPVGKEYMVDVTNPILVGPNTTVLGVRGQSIIKAIRSSLANVVGIRGIFRCAQTADGSPAAVTFSRGPGGTGAQFNVTWTDNGDGTFSYASSTLAAAGTGYRPPNQFGAGQGDFITVNGPNAGEFLTFQVVTTTSWRGPIATYSHTAGSAWTTNPATVSQNSSTGQYDSDWIYTPAASLGDNYIFKDLVIDGNDYNSSSSTAFTVQSLTNYLFGISGQAIKDVTVTGCEIRYCPGSGLQFYRHRRATITDNWIHHCGYGVAAGGDRNAISCFGFYLTNQPSATELNSRGLIISNNTFSDCRDVLISYSTHRGVIISNNILRGSFAIEGQAASFQVADTLANNGGIEIPNDQIITGNYIDGIRADAFNTTNAGTGIAPQAGNEGRCLIANNIVRNFSGYGIECTNLNNYRVLVVGNMLENVCSGEPSLQAVFVDAAELEFIGNNVKTQTTGNSCLLMSSRCRNAKINGNTFDTVSTTAAITFQIGDTTPGQTQFIKISENVFTEIQKNGVLLQATNASSPVTVNVLDISSNLFRNCNKGGGSGNQEVFIGCTNGATMTIDTILLHDNRVWQSGSIRGTAGPFDVNNVLNSSTTCSLLSVKGNILCRGFTYPVVLPSYTPLTTVIDGNSFDGNRVGDLPISGVLPFQGHFTRGDRLRKQTPAASGIDYEVCVQSGSLVTDGGWVANHSYSLVTNGAPTSLVGGGMVQQVTAAGTSGSTTPTWSTTIGQTTTDGTVVWTCTDTQAIFKGLVLSA